MHYQIAYLNIYGNAGILAEAIANSLTDAELVDLSCQEIADGAGVYLLVFEMTQNAIPLKIMDALELLEGKTILCAAASTMALYENAESVEKIYCPSCRMNVITGGYLSVQGKRLPM